MPNRDIHVQFDQYLIEKGYLPGYDYAPVHNRIDKGAKKFGGQHRELDFYHDEEGLRDWLQGVANKNAKQEKLTAYLRAGLAHFSLDEWHSKYLDKKWDNIAAIPHEKIFESALKSMIGKGTFYKFFKERA